MFSSVVIYQAIYRFYTSSQAVPCGFAFERSCSPVSAVLYSRQPFAGALSVVAAGLLFLPAPQPEQEKESTIQSTSTFSSTIERKLEYISMRTLVACTLAARRSKLGKCLRV